jgi:hypothetical protein
MDIPPPAAAASGSGFYAVVLLRKGEEATTAEVLLPSSKFFTYPGPRGSERDVATADDLGKAARAAAEEELHNQGELQGNLSRVVLVYADNPTTTQDLQYGDECDLKPSSQLNALAGEDELARYNDVRRFYVLVTLPRQTVPMQIEAPTPAPANRGI